MIAGTTLLRIDGNEYFSLQFSRGGLAGTFSVDVTQWLITAGSFEITVEHRNSEDTTWSSAGVFGTIGSTGEKALDVTGLKEILRYKFKFLTTTTATDAVHFFMQAPSWRPF